MSTDDNSSMSKTSLHRKRGAILAAITNFEKYLNVWQSDITSRDIDFLQVSLENIQRKFLIFEKLQDQLEEIDANEIQERERYEIAYNKAIALARKCLRNHNESCLERKENSNSSIINQTVSLPQISLPKFDGSVENWASFHDVFVSLIDKNLSLSSVQKLQYLRLSLSGRAANAIEALETIEGNYEIAMGILKKKFECTRRTLHRHWSLLKNYPKIIKESPSEISKFLDHLNLNIRALENLSAPISQWDVPIIDLILSKLSSHLALQWELTLDNSSLPSYQELINFLEKRANCSDYSQASSKEDNMFKEHRGKRSNTRGQSFFIDNNSADKSKTIKSCPLCSDNHPLYKCDAFQKLSPVERRKKASELSLCFNCLWKNHNTKACWSKLSCKHCNKRHHSMLHEQKQTPSEASIEEASTSNA